MRRERAAALAIGLGLLIAAVVQILAPLASPPLYDGVVVVAPYVYVNPLAGQPGGAQGSSEHLAMLGHTSPQVVAGTPEQPAQAQMVAEQGSFVLPQTATSIDVAITPLDPAVDAGATGAAQILGNVYRITVVDQNGTMATAPASALVSVVLRAPSDVAGSRLALLINNVWVPQKAETGFASTFVAVATRFGDFAVIVPGTAPTPAATASAAAPSAGASAGGSSPASSGAASASGEPSVTAGDVGASGSSGGSISPQVIGAVAFAGLLVVMIASSLLGSRREGKP